MMPVFTGGNQLTLLDSGREYFPALLGEIALAQHEIRLETYIYSDDAAGEAVTAALSAAARRGVRVTVLVDGFGTRGLADRFIAQFAAVGVLWRAYRPPSWLRPVRGLRRLHRKLVTIDQKVAFVGGINVTDDFNTPPGLSPRRDLALRAQGPVVAQVVAAMQRLWLGEKARVVVSPSKPDQAMRAALVQRDNVLHRREIEQAYLAAMRSASHEIVIASAYFFPSGRFRRALMASARRGVVVKLLLQGPSDHPLHKAAEIHLYRTLLRAGIQIIEYRTSFMHAKAAVVDGRWLTVGSSNIDPFSLWLSHEANLISDDATLAVQLRATLGNWIAEHGSEVSLSGLESLSAGARIRQWLAFHLTRRIAEVLNLNGKRDP